MGRQGDSVITLYNALAYFVGIWANWLAWLP